jgi:hypothetical protein
MRQFILETSATVGSAIGVLDCYGWPDVSVQGVVTGAATYTVQVTLDKVEEMPPAAVTWFDVTVPALVGATANQIGAIPFPVAAIRVNQTAGAGSMKLTVLQIGRNT